LLLQVGLPSLAVPGRTGSLIKWKEQLNGKTLFIVYDRDEAGMRSAARLFKKQGYLQLSELAMVGVVGYRLTWPIEWGTDITEARYKLIPLLRRQYEKAKTIV